METRKKAGERITFNYKQIKNLLLKRRLEKGQEKLNLSKDSKVSFHRLLLKTRFTELDYVIGNNYLSEIQKSSERFAYQAGVLAEELLKEGKDKRKESIIKEYKLLNKLLNDLKNKYDANSSYRILIQHGINSLNILSERIK